MRMAGVVATCLLAAGCAHTMASVHAVRERLVIMHSRSEPVPGQVEVRYVALPPELTKDCITVATPVGYDAPVSEVATDLANARKVSNQDCADRMKKIQALQGQIVGH